MAMEECRKCEAYGFFCKRGNWLQQITGRQKIVIVPSASREFAHDFTIETCEVVTGEVEVSDYGETMKEYLEKVQGIHF